jgi:S1-C subfamily serine protease
VTYRLDIEMIEKQATEVPLWMQLDAKPREASGHGSGTIIHESGYILTSAHVVKEKGWKGKVTITVAVRGQPQAVTLEGTVMAIDTKKDLAVVQVNQRFPFAGTIAQPGELQDGEAVYNVGYPFDFGEMIGRGHVMRQDYVPSGDMSQRGTTLLLDISDGSGTSGSAILSENTGKIVGVMMAYTFRRDGPDMPPMVVRVAVPVEKIRSFLDENGIPYHSSPPGTPVCE